MKKRYCILILVVCICLMFIPSLASADLLKVDIDLTSFAGSPVTLGFALFEYTGLADSSVEIDNIAWDGVFDFEGPHDLEFEGWYSIFPGSLDSTVTATGNAMRMEDEPSMFITIAQFNYHALDLSIKTLSFDLNTSLVGDDYFQVSIFSDDENIPDLLLVDATGVDPAYTSPLTTVVPVPGALLLAGLGLGTSAFGILRKKRKVPSKSILLHSLKS